MLGIFLCRRAIALLSLAVVSLFIGCPARPPATQVQSPPTADESPASEDGPPTTSDESAAVDATPAESTTTDTTSAPLSDVETKKLVAWLREIGASVEQNEQGEILSLVLGFTEFGDADVEKIARLPQLEFLGLDHTNITDKGVAALAPLASLKALNLSSNSLTGAGLAPVAKLKNLAMLDLSELPIDDKALATLAALKDLKQLNLTDTKVTLEGTIAFARGLPQLEVAAPFGRLLGGTRLTMDPSVVDADLARLKPLSTLRELNLWECDQITDAGIAHVQGLTQLTSLELGFTKVTSEGLEPLAALANLERLDLRETAASMSAALQLVAKLPKLHVLADWGEARGASEVTLAPSAVDEQLAALRHLPELASLSLWRCDKLTDEALPALAKLSGLRELNLGATNVTDEGLAVLEQLPDLERLILANTPITDKSLAHIGKLVKLKSLDLSSTDVTDEGLALLAGLQALESLSLATTGVTNGGLVHVAALESLTTLDLEETRVGAPLDASDSQHQAFESLSSMPHLRRLQLSLSRADDWTLAQLTPLESLGEIDLWGTAVTDAGLVELAKLPRLKQIGLVATNVTPDGVAALQKGLTDAKIIVGVEPLADDKPHTEHRTPNTEN